MKKIESEKRIEYYKSALPHGYKCKVAELAKCRRASVSEFLRGKYYSVRIENAVLIVLAELRKEQEQKKELFKNAGIELV